MDATRSSDKEIVLMKRINKAVHPYELEIAQYFSTEPISADPRNHCCPIYEVLQDPTDENTIIIVMPHLRRFINPAFQTIGEAVEFFRQVFEVRIDLIRLVISHRQLCNPGIAIYARAPRCPSVRILSSCFVYTRSLVVYSDCMTLNIMMDARPMYPNGFHPRDTFLTPDYSSFAKYYSRTRRPVKYYFIDFGIARRFEESDANPTAVPILSADRTVPEYQEDNTSARDPFSTDVYLLGNVIRKDFLEVCLNNVCAYIYVLCLFIDSSTEIFKPDVHGTSR